MFAYTLIPNQEFAGNSVANLGLAGLCLVTLGSAKAIVPRILAVFGGLCGVALMIAGNLHGVGFAVGAVAGVTTIAVIRRTKPSDGS